jgi:ribonuclease I
MALFVGTRILFSIALFAMMLGFADAQDRRQNAPGQFDYYVLSLSWSPSTCSGLQPREYFDVVRRAREKVVIPEQYSNPTAPLSVTPSQVINAFISTNSYSDASSSRSASGAFEIYSLMVRTTLEVG